MVVLLVATAIDVVIGDIRSPRMQRVVLTAASPRSTKKVLKQKLVVSSRASANPTQRDDSFGMILS